MLSTTTVPMKVHQVDDDDKSKFCSGIDNELGWECDCKWHRQAKTHPGLTYPDWWGEECNELISKRSMRLWHKHKLGKEAEDVAPHNNVAVKTHLFIGWSFSSKLNQMH